MKFFSYAIFVLFLGLAISSCKGDDGADGTDGIDGITGPAGADGADGADGLDGLDGQDGQDGNANVIYSEWAVPTWVVGSFYGVALQEYTYTVPELTQDMVDHSAVLMYWKNNAQHVWQLPLSVVDNDLALDYTYGVNYIYLYMYDESNTSVAPSAYGPTNLFKYIIIEGNVSAGTKVSAQQEIHTELKNAGIDINNYYEVCDYYGINP